MFILPPRSSTQVSGWKGSRGPTASGRGSDQCLAAGRVSSQTLESPGPRLSAHPQPRARCPLSLLIQSSQEPRGGGRESPFLPRKRLCTHRLYVHRLFSHRLFTPTLHKLTVHQTTPHTPTPHKPSPLPPTPHLPTPNPPTPRLPTPQPPTLHLTFHCLHAHHAKRL